MSGSCCGEGLVRAREGLLHAPYKGCYDKNWSRATGKSIERVLRSDEYEEDGLSSRGLKYD